VSSEIAWCEIQTRKIPKEQQITNKIEILNEGVIMDEIGIEEIDQVIAPGVVLGD